MLTEPCEILECEETLIRLECVQIFGKYHFYRHLFDVCFRFEIALDKIIPTFFSHLAFLKQSNSKSAKFDISSYANLLNQVAESNNYSDVLKQKLWLCFQGHPIQDYNEATAYIKLSETQGVEISKMCKKWIWTSVALSAIQLDGVFAWWEHFSKKNERTTVKSTLKSIGVHKSSEILNQIFDLLSKESRPLDEPAMKKLEELETAFFFALDEEKVDLILENLLISNIEQYNATKL